MSVELVPINTAKDVLVHSEDGNTKENLNFSFSFENMPISGKIAVIGAATVVGIVAGPAVVTTAITSAGFGSGGIVSGSLAATFMSSYGGAVGAGSACATLQSIGAAGLGVTGTVLSGAAVGAASAATAAIGTLEGVQDGVKAAASAAASGASIAAQATVSAAAYGASIAEQAIAPDAAKVVAVNASLGVNTIASGASAVGVGGLYFAQAVYRAATGREKKKRE
ncbi:hypothetical protein BX616_009968 [Lobosporangium transversale]|uniref:Uncharacterized protein n=1 Tax=Lobosporangium transversale TaxID=64571 RepID=A0A1Y2GLC2_9FUNG|nr:hypothetical protein BCR41DRAFT_355958 [Lobosporangium transversale]KAF9913482.1 hypothetical protein BX616_009968 [Lobosporangium transversale]ORZ12953.1 hypothetical protein BCR41DRAFT_355958 [Lobosporangium transversale]|eukprot:XP_021880302.1 hypothetical protein BCR41DRAFT_355958 [Lobosporangium transversale]